ncbi:hypothetical protein [Corynebacterium variabile]|uniref:Transmembrane protein n=1 Tax=Corynebacterium variabile TaxID=1727 RepID=A0A4Y4C5S9_9CORY|nr:hypothetical protein [Corynebacterium variabile]GEC86480.1 hypothetical protein CVA01_17940 [Corynebacterium variabile]
MSEKLTVAELLARNAREGGRNASDRPRRRRNLDDGGVSVSELTGSIPVVKIDDEDGQGEAAEGAGNTADAESVVAGATGTPEGAVAERHGGHEADDPEEAEAPEASEASGASESHEGFDEQSTIVQAVVPDSLLTSANPSGEFVAVDSEDAEAVNGDAAEEDTADAADTADADDTVAADADVVEGEVVDDDTDATDIDDAADADKVDAPDEADDLAVVASAGAGATAGAGDLAASSLAEPEADRASAAVPAAVPAEAPAAAASKKTRAPKDDEIVEYEDDTVSWPAVVAQSAAAVILGVLIFFGFTLLWDNLGTVLVLVMALVVTCVCVGVVHSLLRHRDTLLLVLTFVVGIALTVGPRLIMSI